jgi:transcriptional regulator with XRE-family HTH domain
MSWGLALRKYRQESRQTIEQTAEELGIEPRTISRWERESSQPTGLNLERLKAVLGKLQPITVDRALVILVETCSKPAMLYDRQHKLVMTSAIHQEMYQYRLQDVLGMSSAQTASPHVRSYMQKDAAQISEMERAPTITRAVFRVVRKPGDPGPFQPKAVTYLRATGYVVRDDRADYMGSFTISDIIEKATFDALPEGFVPS